MDNVTHSLTGLLMSRAGLDRFTCRAALVLILAANIPDVDVASLFWGAAAYLRYHRWFAHSIVALPFMATIPVLIAYVFNRWRPARARFRLWPAYFLSILGTASHLLLDWTNSYGTRLLLPFSNERLSLDSTFVVDAWILTLLLIVSIWPLLSRLVSDEIGAKPNPQRAAALFALIFLVVYDGARIFLHQRAIEVQQSRIYQTGVPTRTAAEPDPWNPMQWEGLVETPDAFVTQHVNLLGDFDPTAGRVLYKQPSNPAIESAKQTDLFQSMLAFASYVYWTSVPADQPQNGTQVELTDLRFGVPPHSGLNAIALLDAQNRVIETSFRFRPR